MFETVIVLEFDAGELELFDMFAQEEKRIFFFFRCSGVN